MSILGQEGLDDFSRQEAKRFEQDWKPKDGQLAQYCNGVGSVRLTQADRDYMINWIDTYYTDKINCLAKNDPEACHGSADKILLDCLKGLGFKKIIDAFENLTRWTA